MRLVLLDLERFRASSLAWLSLPAWLLGCFNRSQRVAKHNCSPASNNLFGVFLLTGLPRSGMDAFISSSPPSSSLPSNDLLQQQLQEELAQAYAEEFFAGSMPTCP